MPRSFVSEAHVISVVALNLVEAAVLFHAHNAESVSLDAGHVGIARRDGTCGRPVAPRPGLAHAPLGPIIEG